MARRPPHSWTSTWMGHKLNPACSHGPTPARHLRCLECPGPDGVACNNHLGKTLAGSSQDSLVSAPSFGSNSMADGSHLPTASLHAPRKGPLKATVRIPQNVCCSNALVCFVGPMAPFGNASMALPQAAQTRLSRSAGAQRLTAWRQQLQRVKGKPIRLWGARRGRFSPSRRVPPVPLGPHAGRRALWSPPQKSWPTSRRRQP